jgi:hypothetical protein
MIVMAPRLLRPVAVTLPIMRENAGFGDGALAASPRDLLQGCPENFIFLPAIKKSCRKISKKLR